MKLRFLYALYLLVLHLVIAGLLYWILKDKYKWYFLGSELFLIASGVIGYQVFKSLTKPINLMYTGITAVKEGDVNVRFAQTKSEEMNTLIEVFNIMLDRLSEERLRTQEQAYFLENIVRAAPIGMVLLDYDDHIAMMNPRARSYFQVGNDDKVLVGLRQLSSPLAQSIAQLETGVSKVINLDGVQRFRCHVNSVIHKGFDRRFVMIEELSQELLENEKKAYGKVIRMMAHEVNNSMGAINSILQSVIDFGFEDENEFTESLALARDRNEELAKFMKNFAEVIRLPPPMKREVEIVQFVANTAQLMRGPAEARGIRIVLKNEISSHHLNMDPSQIRQVLVNVIKNAIESIDQGGNIVITVSDVGPQIVVADNGPGISLEAEEKLFSPFYSTKPTGQGIGLILTRDILLNHDAKFSLRTNRETGWTLFSIDF
ncbi:MAG: ATP-binding protein [Bacteroidota bacterium]